MPDNFGDNSLAGFVNYRRANTASAVWATVPHGSPYTVYDEKFEAVDPLIKGIANTMPDGGFLEAFRADVRAGRLPAGVVDRRPRRRTASTPARRARSRARTTPAGGARRADGRSRGLGQDGAARQLRRERRLLRPRALPGRARRSAPTGKLAGDATLATMAAEAVHARRPRPAPPSQPPPDGRRLRPGPARADVRGVAVEPGRLGQLAGVRPHLGAAVPRAAASASASRNISPWRRAVCRRPDLRPSTSPIPNRHAAARRCPGPRPRATPTGLRAAQEQLDQVDVPPATSSGAGAGDGRRGPRAPCPTSCRPSARDRAGHQRRADHRSANDGDAGAVFHVYDRLHLDRIPRRYTVEAGRVSSSAAGTTTDDGGRYDLWVLGPNGFHRSFTGGVGPRSLRRAWR